MSPEQNSIKSEAEKIDINLSHEELYRLEVDGYINAFDGSRSFRLTPDSFEITLVDLAGGAPAEVVVDDETVLVVRAG